jgi:hypothetical protein
MVLKELLLEKLDALLPEEQERVMEFLDFLEFSRKAKVGQFLPQENAVSPLGKRLREIRAEIIASGEPLLTAEQADREKAERRGGYEGEYNE